jgi:hypothetical protein
VSAPSARVGRGDPTVRTAPEEAWYGWVMRPGRDGSYRMQRVRLPASAVRAHASGPEEGNTRAVLLSQIEGDVCGDLFARGDAWR